MTALFTQTNYNTQTGTSYPLNIDAAVAVLARGGAAFLVQPQATPNMTVQVLAGSLFNLATASDVEVGAQNSAAISAPGSNSRNDLVYIDQKTGVMGIQTGIAAASPTDPQVPPGKIAIGRIRLAATTTAITASLIDDLRNLQALGFGSIAGLDEGPAPSQVPAAALFRAGAFRDVVDTAAGSFGVIDAGKAVVLDGAGKLPVGTNISQCVGGLFTGKFVDSQQSIPAAGSTLARAHGLGVKPFGVLLVLHCVTAEFGWSAGDEIELGSFASTPSNLGDGFLVYTDATNVNVIQGSAGNIELFNKSTGAAVVITQANWKLIIKAWV